MARSAISQRRLAVRNTANSLDFINNGTKVDILNNTSFDRGASDWTILFWMKLEALQKSGNKNIFTQNGGMLYIQGTNSRQMKTLITGGAKTFTNSYFEENKWYRVAAVYDKTASTFTLYANGEVMDTLTSVTAASDTSAFVFGANSSAVRSMAGKATQVTLFSEALSSQQISDDYYDNVKPSATRVFDFDFSEGSGTTLTDLSGNSNTGTIDTATWSTDTPMKSRTAISTARTAITSFRIPLDFSNLGVTSLWDFRDGQTGNNSGTVRDLIGTRDFVWEGGTAIGTAYTTGSYEVAFNSANADCFIAPQKGYTDTNPTKLTAFSWVKLANSSGAQQLLSAFNTGTGAERAWYLLSTWNEKIRCILSSDGSTTAYDTDTDASATIGVWSMYSFVYDGDVLSFNIYFDDTDQAITTISGSIPASIHNLSGDNMAMGCYLNSGTPANKSDSTMGISGLAVGKAMTQAEITSLYNLTNKLGGYK